MKSLYKSLTAWLLCLFFVFSSFIVSFADVKSLMIGSSSNALMTLELNDDDYGIMPLSSLGTVQNTVEPNNVAVVVMFQNPSGQTKSATVVAYKNNNNRYQFSYAIPSGWYFSYMNIQLYPIALPGTGTYEVSFDYSSDISYPVSSVTFWTEKKNSNAVTETKQLRPTYVAESGDVYIAPQKINMTNLAHFDVSISTSDQYVTHVGGSFAFRFKRVETDTSAPNTAGTDTSSSDYQSGVSSSLSDLSSSVDEVSDEIGFVAEAIQNLQGAMEPHYNNVLTQLHHITEQLHAFYDQIYNNIHLKEYALWQDIKTAIENIDLEVNVNLDKLKTSIDNMSQAVQNKLQSVTDTITGGYNNSGMQEDNNELSGALDELDNAEQEVLDDVNGYIEGFEYPSFDGISSGIIGALSFFGGLLHSIFLGMGEFGLIITFSLTMIFVLIIVGYHRIRS